MTSNIHDEKLTAYALGEFFGGDARKVEKIVETDSGLRRALDEIRATAQLARDALVAGDSESLRLTDQQRQEVCRIARQASKDVTEGLRKGQRAGSKIMKIICENCSAKYSIADEKVRGKVFKIRCKKCGESIVIRGDVQAEPAPAPEMTPPPMPEDHGGAEEEDDAETRVFDYSGYQDGGETDVAVWHIVVEGEQQGPYTTAQIAEYVQAGSLENESFIWKEGFNDWTPIANVEEIQRLLTGAPAPAAAPAAAPVGVAGGGMFDSPAADADGLFDSPAADVGGGLFDSPAADAGGGLFDSPAADAGGGGLFDSPAADAGGGDIFSSHDGATSPGDVFSSSGAMEQAEGGGLFGGDAADMGGGDLFADTGGDDDGGGLFASTEAQADDPRVSAEQAMMTGQRSENSVLFSLSNLQALASSGTDASAGGMGGTFGSSDEVSGLIDIRSMAGSMGGDADGSGMEDLISIGGGGFAPSLGAPVLAASRSDSMSTGVKIGIAGGGVAVLLGVVVLVVVLLQPKEEEKTGPSAQEQQIALLMKQIEAMGKAGGNDVDMAALKKKLAAEQMSAQGEQGSAQQASDKDSSKSKSSGKSSGKSKTSGKPKSSGKSSKGASSGSLMGGSSSSKPKKKSKGSDELDDLLGGSTSAPKKKKAEKSAGGTQGSGGGANVPDKLSRKQVQSGMNAVAGSVKRCGQGQSGTVTVKATIATTGRVVSATTTGGFAGSPAGLCAARAVRRARFPQAKNKLTVTYPFKF